MVARCMLQSPSSSSNTQQPAEQIGKVALVAVEDEKEEEEGLPDCLAGTWQAGRQAVRSAERATELTESDGPVG